MENLDPPSPPKSRMGKWRVFALRAASSLIWEGWGFAVPFYFVQDCRYTQNQVASSLREHPMFSALVSTTDRKYVCDTQAKSPQNEWRISLRSWVELHFKTISYILSFNYSYRYEINLIRTDCTQLIHRFCTAKKKLSEYWAPDINT